MIACGIAIPLGSFRLGETKMKNDYYIAFVCDTDTIVAAGSWSQLYIVAAGDTIEELEYNLNEALNDGYLEESDFHDIIVAKTELGIELNRKSIRWNIKPNAPIIRK